MPSASPDLVCIDPVRIDEFWPHVKHFIRAAIERTELNSFDEIERAVLNGKQLLWLAWNGHSIDAAACTELARVGHKTICTLTACAGYQRDRWLPLFEQIEQYARNEGAATMRIIGRKGWQRVLDGYHVEHVILEKTL